MGLALENVVSVAERPAGAKMVRRLGGSFITDSVHRRGFLRIVGAGGVGIGLATLGLLPPLRRAKAGHTTYPLHEDCAGIDYGGCAGCLQTDSDVSSAYCASNNWHRHDTVPASGGGGVTEYAIRNISCNGKNAWKWVVAACCGGRFNKIYRCSDGKKRLCFEPGDCSPWLNTVCPHQVNNGTAC